MSKANKGLNKNLKPKLFVAGMLECGQLKRFKNLMEDESIFWNKKRVTVENRKGFSSFYFGIWFVTNYWFPENLGNCIASTKGIPIESGTRTQVCE